MRDFACPKQHKRGSPGGCGPPVHWNPLNKGRLAGWACIMPSPFEFASIYVYSPAWWVGLQVGNAVTEGREVVIGLGSMQVINAALFAFSGRMLDGTDPPAGELPPAPGSCFTTCHVLSLACLRLSACAQMTRKACKAGFLHKLHPCKKNFGLPWQGAMGRQNVVAVGAGVNLGRTVCCAGRDTQVYAGVPYYSGYPYAAALLGNGLNFTSQQSPGGPANESVVEVICSPNNPDASMLPRTLPGARPLPSPLP